MKAVLCRQLGPPQGLGIGEIAVPQAGPGQVRIRVDACGINFPDILLVAGRYQDKPPLPFVPGGEVAGVVDQLGAGVTGLRPGQPVMAATMLGGLAEYAIARARDVEERPPALSALEAAAFPGVYGTACHALVQRAQLRAGETLLVLGAAGGTGIAAVQIGRALGARVLAAASGEAKLAFLRSQGADATVDCRTAGLREAVREFTGGRGVDVVFDPVGGELFDQASRCLAWNGRLLVVGFASGTIPRFPVNLALLKGYALVGVYYGRFRDEEPEQAAANMRTLRQLLDAGRIAPPVHRVFALEEAAAALACLQERSVMGKVVVSVRGEALAAGPGRGGSKQ
ncbi:MAG: NADPH:quinone oxidoreductase family protein [Gammaproteobacteria bacterium]|nr:NADPH:quinone oxidoreductase family protein [Gammaproteobacteria bacterium]